MATLIVEDGSGLANANTYASLEAVRSWHAVRSPNRDAWDELTGVEEVALIIEARQALDALYRWRGQIVSTNQALAWPRNYCYDDDGRLLANDAVPPVVIDAQAQLTYRLLAERSSMIVGMAGPSGAKSESIGDWSMTYREYTTTEWPEINRMLDGIIEGGPGGSGYGQVKVERWS